VGISRRGLMFPVNYYKGDAKFGNKLLWVADLWELSGRASSKAVTQVSREAVGATYSVTPELCCKGKPSTLLAKNENANMPLLSSQCSI
jgi:hypothetical protein